MEAAASLHGDGRIVVVGYVAGGDFGVARYLAQGSLDTSFGAAGVLELDFFGGFDTADAILAQPDGKIVVAGSTSGGLGVVRLLP